MTVFNSHCCLFCQKHLFFLAKLIWQFSSRSPGWVEVQQQPKQPTGRSEMGSTWCPRCSNCFDCGDCLWLTWIQWMIIAMSWNVEQMMHMRTNEQNVVYNTTCNEGGRFKCVKKLLWNPFKQLATKVGESNEVWTGTGWETHSSAKVRHINQLFSSNQPSLVTSTCNLFRSQRPSWWNQSKV